MKVDPTIARACTVAALAALLVSCAAKPKPEAPVYPAAAAPAAQAPFTPQATPSAPAATTGAGAAAAPSAAALQAAFAADAGERVFFALDQHDLSADARATLQRQAQWLRSRPEVKILIAGNCDERGTREYNFALGARRAEAARAFLVSQGIDPSRISTVSYGKERPIAPGADEASWSQNRNAHTVIADLGV